MLSTKLTAYQYVPKIPDEQTGMIYACGFSSYYSPPTPADKIRNIRNEISHYEEQYERHEIKKEKGHIVDDDDAREIVAEIQQRKKRIEELEKEQARIDIEKDQEQIESEKSHIQYHEVEEEIYKRRGDKENEKRHRGYITDYQKSIKERQKRIKDNQKKLAGTLLVPEGAMEWLLHEVGHWVAATEEERRLPNFGFGVIREGICTCTENFTECRCGDEREWQAWAFEEIILSPFGNSRFFCPPPHRGGLAFDKNQPIPDTAFRHIETRLRADSIHVEQWRQIWGEWLRWGQSLGTNAPWSWGSCE